MLRQRFLTMHAQVFMERTLNTGEYEQKLLENIYVVPLGWHQLGVCLRTGNIYIALYGMLVD